MKLCERRLKKIYVTHAIYSRFMDLFSPASSTIFSVAPLARNFIRPPSSINHRALKKVETLSASDHTLILEIVNKIININILSTYLNNKLNSKMLNILIISKHLS